MKRWLMFSAVCVISSATMTVHAEEKRVHYFGQVEYLTYSDAFKKVENSWDSWMAVIQDSLDPGDSLSSDKTTTGGVGGRFGALVTTPIKGFSLGGSLGFIKGPSFEANRTVLRTSPTGFFEKENLKFESTIVRGLIESKYDVPLGEAFHARVGLGLGLAQVENTSHYAYESSHYAPDSGDTSMHTTKFTWEVGPAIAYMTKTVGVELAVTYSQMPKLGPTNVWANEFKWNPFGIRLGVEF